MELTSAFEELDVALVAGSVDNAADTHALTQRLGVTYPVLIDLRADEIARTFGAYASERGFLHATGFIVRPDATIELAVYSSGSRGRVTASDALELIGARERA